MTPKAHLLLIFLVVLASCSIDLNRTNDLKMGSLPRCPYHGKKLNAD